LQIENWIIGKVESSESGKKNGIQPDREINFVEATLSSQHDPLNHDEKKS
jgi:hypothetical protein